MAQILIRGLDESVVQFFKKQAAKNGRSLQKHIVQALADMANAHGRHERAVATIKKLQMLPSKKKKNKGPSSTELLRKDRNR